MMGALVRRFTRLEMLDFFNVSPHPLRPLRLQPGARPEQSPLKYSSPALAAYPLLLAATPNQKPLLRGAPGAALPDTCHQTCQVYELLPVPPKSTPATHLCHHAAELGGVALQLGVQCHRQARHHALRGAQG
jgi:hypothetical protein